MTCVLYYINIINTYNILLLLLLYYTEEGCSMQYAVESFVSVKILYPVLYG